jgi:hypothetical protein
LKRFFFVICETGVFIQEFLEDNSFENYSAELEKEIDLIITRNLKDFKHSQLAVMTPDNYMKIKSSNR